MQPKHLALCISLTSLSMTAAHAYAEAGDTRNPATRTASGVTTGTIDSPAQIYGLTGFSGSLGYSGGREQSRFIGADTLRENHAMLEVQASSWYGGSLGPDWSMTGGAGGKVFRDTVESSTDSLRFPFQQNDQRDGIMLLLESALTWKDEWTIGVLYNGANMRYPSYYLYNSAMYAETLHYRMTFLTLGLSWHDPLNEIGISVTPHKGQTETITDKVWNSAQYASFHATVTMPTDLSLHAFQTVVADWRLVEGAHYSLYDNFKTLSPIERDPVDKAKFSAGIEHDLQKDLSLGGGVLYTGAAYEGLLAYSDATPAASINTYGAETYGTYAWSKASNVSLHGVYNYASRKLAQSDLSSGLANAKETGKYMVQTYSLSLSLGHAF